jgi:DNA (cytosine-5)-methyltransferase 1
MRYISTLDSFLTPRKRKTYTVIDLYAGCGGLSLGFEANGFETIGYEMNEDACESYNSNLNGICRQETLTMESKFPKADVLIAGPPCQPFSVVGSQLGLNDFRNGFPVCINAVKKIKPKLFLFENVRGLLYKNRDYFDEIIKQLETIGYTIEIKLLNAKQFDVPQNRERVLIVGYKKGIFNFPKENDYVVTAGTALDRTARRSTKGSKFRTKSMLQYIAKYEKASNCITPRDLHLDRPARTLTCRNLAGSTGDMQRIKLANGKRRRLSQKEAATLQSFPSWFEFYGNETSVFNQIGNAVPPMMSYHIAKSIKEYLRVFYPSKKTLRKAIIV